MPKIESKKNAGTGNNLFQKRIEQKQRYIHVSVGYFSIDVPGAAMENQGRSWSDIAHIGQNLGEPYRNDFLLHSILVNILHINLTYYPINLTPL